LYNNRPRKVALSPYHYTANVYFKQDNPELPTFYFDPIINPISAYRVTMNDRNRKQATTEIEDLELDDDELEEIRMPDDFEPFLNEEPLYDNKTTDGIALLWAPRPYHMRTGRMRRAFDVPLVSGWFKERCKPDWPVKVRVSYQKLLKCWVLNELKKR